MVMFFKLDCSILNSGSTSWGIFSERDIFSHFTHLRFVWSLGLTLPFWKLLKLWGIHQNQILNSSLWIHAQSTPEQIIIFANISVSSEAQGWMAPLLQPSFVKARLEKHFLCTVRSAQLLRARIHVFSVGTCFVRLTRWCVYTLTPKRPHTRANRQCTIGTAYSTNSLWMLHDVQTVSLTIFWTQILVFKNFRIITRDFFLHRGCIQKPSKSFLFFWALSLRNTAKPNTQTIEISNK